MTKTLKAKIDAFCKWAGYDRWEKDPDGELTMFDKGEPFGLTEYRKGSEIRNRWESLQKEIAKS